MRSFQLRVMQVLEKSEEGDRISRQCDLLIVTLVTLNVIAVILESVDWIYLAYGLWLERFEIFSIAFFSIEYLLRIWSNGARYSDSSFRGRREYALSFFGLIDLIAILPYFLQIFMPGIDLRILRVFRLLRLLKLSHYSSALEDLFGAMYDERRAFAAVGYILAIVIISTSSLMYFVEGKVQPDKLQSIPDAMYWSIISLTTVGYGDVTPVTTLGKIISTLTAFMGVATVALFTGIIASSFHKQLVRKRLVYEQELRKAFADGIITEDEETILAALKTRFDLNDDLTSALRDSIKNETQGFDGGSASQMKINKGE